MTTRVDIAEIVHRRLRGLATDAGLSFATTGNLTEGDYTDAISAALRSVGAVDPDTDVIDVALITTATLDTVIGQTSSEMLSQLELHYATLTDIKVGPREEKLSQIRTAIAAISGRTGGSGSGRIVIRKLTRRADDYEFE